MAGVHPMFKLLTEVWNYLHGDRARVIATTYVVAVVEAIVRSCPSFQAGDHLLRRIWSSDPGRAFLSLPICTCGAALDFINWIGKEVIPGDARPDILDGRELFHPTPLAKSMLDDQALLRHPVVRRLKHEIYHRGFTTLLTARVLENRNSRNGFAKSIRQIGAILGMDPARLLKHVTIERLADLAEAVGCISNDLLPTPVETYESVFRTVAESRIDVHRARVLAAYLLYVPPAQHDGYLHPKGVSHAFNLTREYSSLSDCGSSIVCGAETMADVLKDVEAA